MARSKRSVEKEGSWRLLVNEQRGCGLNIRTFCKQKGISEPSFFAWRKELQKRDAERTADADSNGRLIPVDVVHGTREKAKPGDVTTPLEICTPGGFTLRFDHDTTAETISRLLDVIARYPSEGAASC